MDFVLPKSLCYKSLCEKLSSEFSMELITLKKRFHSSCVWLNIHNITRALHSCYFILNNYHHNY